MPTRYFYDPKRRAVLTVDLPEPSNESESDGFIELPGQLELSIMRQIIIHGQEAVREALDLCEDILQ